MRLGSCPQCSVTLLTTCVALPTFSLTAVAAPGLTHLQAPGFPPARDGTVPLSAVAAAADRADAAAELAGKDPRARVDGGWSRAPGCRRNRRESRYYRASALSREHLSGDLEGALTSCSGSPSLTPRAFEPTRSRLSPPSAGPPRPKPAPGRADRAPPKISLKDLLEQSFKQSGNNEPEERVDLLHSPLHGTTAKEGRRDHRP